MFFYVIIHKRLSYCPCRGHVDGSHDYIWNHNRTTAGTQPMPLSYGHAAAMLIDPMITSLAYGGTTTGPRQGHNQCRYHMVMPRPC